MTRKETEKVTRQITCDMEQGYRKSQKTKSLWLHHWSKSVSEKKIKSSWKQDVTATRIARNSHFHKYLMKQLKQEKSENKWFRFFLNDRKRKALYGSLRRLFSWQRKELTIPQDFSNFIATDILDGGLYLPSKNKASNEVQWTTGKQEYTRTGRC